MLTLQIVQTLLPKNSVASLSNFVTFFNKYAADYGITTPERIASFVGNNAVESLLKPIKEFGNNNYFIKNYWNDSSKAKALGNKSAQDAIDFSGKGFIQLTGRNNYAAVSQRLYKDDRLVKNPNLVLTPEVAMLTSMEWWKMNGMNAVSDKHGIKGVAGKINTGSALKTSKHLPERIKAYNLIHSELKKKAKYNNPFGNFRRNFFGNFFKSLSK